VHAKNSLMGNDGTIGETKNPDSPSLYTFST
jgi:hypothetical protein